MSKFTDQPQPSHQETGFQQSIHLGLKPESFKKGGAERTHNSDQVNSALLRELSISGLSFPFNEEQIHAGVISTNMRIPEGLHKDHLPPVWIQTSGAKPKLIQNAAELRAFNKQKHGEFNIAERPDISNIGATGNIFTSIPLRLMTSPEVAQQLNHKNLTTPDGKKLLAKMAKSLSRYSNMTPEARQKTLDSLQFEIN